MRNSLSSACETRGKSVGPILPLSYLIKCSPVTARCSRLCIILVDRPASLPHSATSSALHVCTPLLDWYIT